MIKHPVLTENKKRYLALLVNASKFAWDNVPDDIMDEMLELYLMFDEIEKQYLHRAALDSVTDNTELSKLVDWLNLSEEERMSMSMDDLDDICGMMCNYT